PREAAARKALDQTLARGAEHYGGFIEEYRRRQADIHQYKTAASETPQDSEWQKIARSAQGDPRTWDTQLIAEVEKRDPAKAAAMRQALLPQPTKRLFDAAEKSFARADAAGGQPAAEASDSVPGKSMTLHEMLMQAPAMMQGQGGDQPPADLAAAARSTAQHALGISDPENVRVTRSADGTYTLSRPAADGSGIHQPFATLDPKTNRLTLSPGPDGQHDQAAISMAAKGSPHGIPIYLPGTQPPLSAAERSELIARGLHATSTTTDRQQADAALTQAGLSPQGIRQLVNEGRLSVQDGQFLNDKFNGGVSSYAAHSAAAPPQPQDSQDKTGKLTPESMAEQLRLREANEQFLHQQYPQVPMDELRRNYNTYRDDYVRKNYDLPDGVDDKTLHHLTSQKQEREKQEVETALKSQQVGFKAALDDLGSLKGLTQRQQDGQGAGKDAQHFFKGYHAAFAVLSKHRDLLQTLSDSIERDMTGKAQEGDAAALASAREKLIDLPDEERRIVLAALHNEAQKRGAVNGAAKGGAGYADAAKQLLHGLFTAGMTKDGSSFWQQAGEAGWRILESGISGNSHANTLEVLKSVPTTGRVTFTGDIRTAEDARRFVEAEMIHAHAVNASVAGDGPAILPREGSELTLTPEQTRLIEDAKNRLARGVHMAQEISALGSDVDPIPNLFASTLGSSAAMMGLMAASRGAAAPFIASLYKGAAYEELSLKYPEASHEAKLKAATLSAVIQTAGDYVGVKAFSGLNIGKLLANPQGLTAAVIGRGLGRAGLSYAVENVVEAGQDIATPAIIQALKLDFPGFDWEQEKKDFWKSRADVAIGMLPLTLLGLGAASVKDYANGKALLSDNAALSRLGLQKNYRKDIIDATRRGDTDTAQLILQEGFKKRDPAIAAESQQEMDAETEKLDGATETSSSGADESAEGRNPYRAPNGTLIIPERSSSSSDPALAEHEKKLQDIANNQPRADKLYNEIPDAKGGKVIGTDIARELLPEFAESREGKINYTNATGRVAQAYAKDRLWREIENPQGRKELMFTAGGVASGKSTAVTDQAVNESDLVYDGTLRETDWSIKTIEHAIAKGWHVVINYVQRPLPLVLKGAIDRAQSKGRWGSLADLPAIHQAAQQSILKIAKHFANNPNFALNIWLNDGKTLTEKPKLLNLEQIDAGGEYSYDTNHEQGLDGRTTQGASGSDSERFRREGAETARRIFEEAVRSGDYEPRVLRLLAKGNPELEALVPHDH
ncbi:MAG: zeta toxin family protein, partial [Prosthecobacter sp.]|uniref:zeta toxin family protein n=1 Tax=Prosthecobacter sp. TaxID=1965333 RepID=UPI003BB03572